MKKKACKSRRPTDGSHLPSGGSGPSIKPSLLLLPNELLLHVSKSLPQHSLYALALSCRRLAPIATDALFLEPVLQGYASGLSFRDACDRKEDRLRLTRKLSCHAWNKWLPWFADHVDELPSLEEILLKNGSAFDEPGCYLHAEDTSEDETDTEEGSESDSDHNDDDDDDSEVSDTGKCECFCDPCCHGTSLPSIELVKTMRVFSMALRLTKATFDATELSSIPRISLSECLLDLTFVEANPLHDAFQNIELAFPRLNKLAITTATLDELGQRVCYSCSEAMLYEGMVDEPIIQTHHLRNLGKLPALRHLKLKGSCQGMTSNELRQLLRRCHSVDLELWDDGDDYSEDDPAESFLAPLLPGLPSVRSLATAVPADWDRVYMEMLCSAIDGGSMPCLRELRIHSAPYLSHREDVVQSFRQAVSDLEECGFRIWRQKTAEEIIAFRGVGSGLPD